MPRTMLIGSLGTNSHASHLGQVHPGTLLEPRWTRDVRHPQVTTPQEPQNLLGPTNKGCFTMGAIPAGNYVGRIPSMVSLSGGSNQGAMLRGALQGVVLRNAGLGSVGLGDFGSWVTGAFSDAARFVQGAGCVAAPVIGSQMTSAPKGSGGDAATAAAVASGLCNSRSSGAPPASSVDSQYRAQNDAAIRAMQQSANNNSALIAALATRQSVPQPSSGISTQTLLIAGGVGVGVIALVLLLK